jgi:hypothetical protein
MNYMQVYKLYTCKYVNYMYCINCCCSDQNICISHNQSIFSHNLILNYRIGKILTGDITHKYQKNYYFGLENIMKSTF